jgi:hypothetical protein
MKKLLLTALAATPFLGTAQQIENIADAPQDTQQKIISEVRSDEKSGAIIWEEDFAGGWPSGWITIDTSGICPWVYSTDGSWGNFNGNNGTAGADPIQSTTGTNGFLICDPDSANNVTYGQPSGSNYQYLSSYFEIPPIDCSTNASVILEFEHNYRYNNSVSMNVLVSTDSVNWTGYDVSDGVANNTESADPALATINLSAIAANQPKVHIRIGWSARVYFWMIDDMVLREGNANDLTNVSGSWVTGAEELGYYQTPLSQLSPITFSGVYTNNGGNNVPNVSQEVTVEFGGSSVHTGASTAATSLVGTIDSVTQAGTFTPASGIGTYDLTWTVSSSDSTDSDMSDNSTGSAFDVTEMVYARDNGVATGAIGNFSSNTGQTFKIGNLFETFGTDEMCWLDVGVSSAAENEGQIIYAEVHRWNATSGNFEFVETTDDYVILNGDLGNVVSLQLLTSVAVDAGETYLVVAGHYGGTDDVRFLLCQSVEEQTVYGFRADGSLVYLSSPRAPIVRMNMDGCSWSVEEGNVADLKAVPNPFNEFTTIQFELGTNANVRLEVLDMEGRIVLSENYGSLSAGSNQFRIDGSTLAAGMYNCRIVANNQVHMQQIVVTK